MLTENEMRKLIADWVKTEHNGVQSDAANSIGVSGNYLGLVLRGKTTISGTMAQKFGYRREVMYEAL